MANLTVGTWKTKQLGLIGVAMTAQGLIRTDLLLDRPETFFNRFKGDDLGSIHPPDGQVEEVFRQIQAYLARERTTFDVKIDWGGLNLTEFQEEVLRATLAIPYGETRSYGEIAGLVGSPRAARAVGQAEARNPMPLIIPCHRVIGSDGGMVGYGGPDGVDVKAWLLALEGR